MPNTYVSPIQKQFADAMALHRLGHLTEAEAAYRAILKGYRGHFGAAHFLGLIFLQRGDAEAAVSQISRALSVASDKVEDRNLAEAHNNRGRALTELKRYGEALASFDSAIATQPNHIEALTNRGAVLHELGLPEASLAASDHVIALRPGYAAAHNNRGKALIGLCRFDEAIVSFNRAVSLQANCHDAFYSRGLVHLLLGDYASGWRDAEHRLSTAEFKGLQQLALPPAPPSFAGKRILAVAEQGIGDEIMFASMIPDLVRNAGSVTLECDPRLSALYSRSFPQVRLIARTKPVSWKKADFDLAMMTGSLGSLYRNAIVDFPRRKSYLMPNPEIVAKWKSRLSGLGPGLKIGISWKGGTDRTRRHARSIPLAQWGPIFAIPGAHFISLQYGSVKSEIDDINRTMARPILSFEASEIDDFDQLAGLVTAVDVIVTVQTTLVHLCGAIGQACRVLVPQVPEWRYGARGKRMAWYESVTLYRQDRPGSWSEPMARLVAGIGDRDG